MLELQKKKGGVLQLVERQKTSIVTNTKERVINIGTDSAGVPEWQYYQELQQSGGVNRSSFSQPAELHYSTAEKWGDAIKSPKGHFATFVAPMDAFKEGWRYTKPYYLNTPLDEDLNLRLMKLEKRYKIRATHTLAVIVSRALGKSLAFKIRRNGGSHSRFKTDVYYRVIPIENHCIHYNDDGDPEYYTPVIQFGHTYKQCHIPAEDAVLYIHKKDPFGNGYHGIPELYPVHNHLAWEMNREKGWATAMDARGISMMQIKIPGFELEDKDKWESSYGNPSTYNVLFTDEKTEVNNIPGVQSTYDPQNDGDATTKQVAASTGFAMSRIDGTQRGQVSGGNNDTDNYYSMLTAIKEENEEQLIELHEILDRTLIGKFDISWAIEPTMDKAKKAQVFASTANAAQVAQAFMTYNQVLDLLDLPLMPDGDVPAEIYIFNQRMEAGMMQEDGMGEGMGSLEDMMKNSGEEGEGEGGPEKRETDPVNKSNSLRQSQTEEFSDPDENRGAKKKNPKYAEQCHHRFDNGERCKNRTLDSSGYCYLHRGVSHSNDSVVEEENSNFFQEPKELKTMLYCLADKSYRDINDRIKDEFGSGIRTSFTSEIKREVLNIQRANDSFKQEIDSILPDMKYSVFLNSMKEANLVNEDTFEYWLNKTHNEMPGRKIFEKIGVAYAKTLKSMEK